MTERIVDLELLVTHLQRELQALNSVVVHQQRELDELRNRIAKLDGRLEELQQPEVRDLHAERPPHY